MPRANGAECGFATVCFEGACTPCWEGSACKPDRACRVGSIACGTGQPVCNETGTPSNPGTSCGVDQVCNPTGDCVACTEGVACEPSNPCRTAAIRCASGAPVCTDVGRLEDGTSCGSNNVCRSGVCATCPQEGFTPEVVDSGGSMTSAGFARGADGVQHAAYYDTVTRTYYYATDSSGAWVRQPVQVNATTYVGHVQLALDPEGHAHMSFTMGQAPELWYATNASGAWVLERVLESAWGARHRIAVDVAGNVHLVLGLFRNGTYPYHLSKRDGVWRIGRIDDKTLQEDTPSVVAGQDGSLHASWTASGVLKHGVFRGAAWEVEDVAPALAASMRWGRGTAIALDVSNRVHIAYTYGETSIRHATNASGAWVATTAANATVYNPDPTRYYDIYLDGGSGPSIALDQQGRVHIAWVALPRGYGHFLNHATNASGAWVNKPYVSMGAGVDFTALFIDEAGKVHLGYTTYGSPYSPRFARQLCPGPAPGIPPLVPASLPEVVRPPVACDGCVRSVVAVGTPRGLRVDWRPVTGATGYTVYVARGAIPTKANHATLPEGRSVSVQGEGLDLTGLAVGETYFVVVTALGASGESVESPVASAKPVADQAGEGFSPLVAAPFLSDARVLANAGDIDNDGYEDLLVGNEMFSSGRGQVSLFLGGAAGLAQTPVWTRTGERADSNTSSAEGTRLGVNVEAAGDVNGDGYADVLVAEGRGLRVYHGSAAGLATTAARTLVFSRNIVLTHGDFNDDALADVVVGTPYRNKDPFVNTWDGAAYVYRGTPTGIGESASWTQLPPLGWSSDMFGATVAAVGDVDGDGFGDLIAGSDWYDGDSLAKGAVLLFRGSATGLAQSSSWRATGVTFEDYFGAAVAGLGDMDGDTFGEVAVGAPHRFGESRVVFYEGVAGGLQTTPFRTFSTAAWPYFGSILESRVGLFGDGRSDLLIGGSYRMALYRGRAQGLEADPVWSLDLQPSELSEFYFARSSIGRFGGPGAIAIVVRGCGGAWYCMSPWGAISYATGRAQGPRVDAGWPVTASSGALARLSGAGLHRGADAESSCTVDFGDGSPSRTVQPCGDVEVGALAHRYWLPGRYTVTLSLGSGASRSSTTVDVVP
ncbi:FG-GAP-like repeat-containing protein [Myxococcus fulvus]|uniref:FG-GAP-like repeat-containing protein n=1 Tax=Myxococcus fulvus TaxID=33 RepID=UPI003B9A7199